MSEQWVVRCESDLMSVYNSVAPRLQDGALQIEIKKWKAKRSLPANGLYWMWLAKMAKHFSKKNTEYTKDDFHDLMRHRFLGYTQAKQIGKTTIEPQLKSTTELNTADFCYYMQTIESWAAQLGCLLPRPEDNEYTDWYKQYENQKGCA